MFTESKGRDSRVGKAGMRVDIIHVVPSDAGHGRRADACKTGSCPLTHRISWCRSLNCQAVRLTQHSHQPQWIGGVVLHKADLDHLSCSLRGDGAVH